MIKRQKGYLGEITVQYDLIKKGFCVVQAPEGLPFDLIAYKGGQFYRVQVKYSLYTENIRSISFSKAMLLDEVDLFAYVEGIGLNIFYSTTQKRRIKLKHFNNEIKGLPT